MNFSLVENKIGHFVLNEREMSKISSSETLKNEIIEFKKEFNHLKQFKVFSFRVKFRNKYYQSSDFALEELN
jgi:hypothetical protein